MGLTFYGANRREEISLTTPYADLPVELAEYLYVNRASCPEPAAFFWELDPYGDTEFREESLLALLERCAILLEEPWPAPCGENPEAVQLQEFLQQLHALCSVARKNSGAVIALGD